MQCLERHLTPRRLAACRATLQPIDGPPLLRLGAVDVHAGDLRAYATLLWVGKAAIIGYVTVSITQRGGPGGVWQRTLFSPTVPNRVLHCFLVRTLANLLVRRWLAPPSLCCVSYQYEKYL